MEGLNICWLFGMHNTIIEVIILELYLIIGLHMELMSLEQGPYDNYLKL